MHRLQNKLGLIYGVLTTLILAIGFWWVYFMSQESRSYEDLQLQRFTSDVLHANLLIRSVADVAHDPAGALGAEYPHLEFSRVATGWDVVVRPAAVEEVSREAARRRRMFLTEGLTLMALLLAGTTVLTLAFRRERDFKRARELFLAGATHEFKTPLASLRLYTETLGRDDLDAGARPRIRASMLQDVERLEGMVEKILAVSREEEMRRGADEAVDLAGVVDDVLADMESFLAGKGARVETSLTPGLTAHGDRGMLAVAVGNLVQNAALYSPPPARIRIGLAREGDDLRLSVADEGPGIARRDRKRIFGSFVRGESPPGSLSKRPSGSGLGLYLVERNVTALGGRVELDSGPGRGSVFTLVLPATKEKA